jgi:hypothetical protein
VALAPIVISLIVGLALEFAGSNTSPRLSDCLIVGLVLGSVLGLLSVARRVTALRDSTPEPKTRSPIKTIKTLNKTRNREYWELWGSQGSQRPLTGVEVGVYRGDHAANILNYLRIEMLHLVDPWLPYVNVDTGLRDAESLHDENYETVLSRFSGNPRVTVHRKTSLDAAQNFPEASLDFVYLDGDHSYEAVSEDLRAWWPKVKPFGVLGGDDFGHCSGHGVIRAASEFSFSMSVPLLYVGDRQFTFIKYA